MLTQPGHGDYAGQLNTKFRVVEAAEPLELELVEVSDLKTSSGQEYFSLVFLGDKDNLLPQKLYALNHETLGQKEIFLVPVGREEDGIKYEAVFNRLTKN
ncbi:hypothetical protein BH20ACI1_BH20ACI1_17860 [soil metagenome]